MELAITIDDLVYQKIMHWIKKANLFEISGLGNVIIEDETIKVVDAILLEQENTSTTTDISGEYIAKAMFHLKDSPGELKWWWHSHVDMPVFWSETDTNTIEELASQGWFSATVFNKKKEMRSAYAQISPIKMLVDDIDTYVLRNLDFDMVNKWDEEYEDKVTVKTPVYPLTAGAYIGGSGVYAHDLQKQYASTLDELSQDEVEDIVEEVTNNKQGQSWAEEYDEIQAALKRGEIG